MNRNYQQSRKLRSALEDLTGQDGVIDADLIFGTARDLGYNVDRQYLLEEIQTDHDNLKLAYGRLKLICRVERWLFGIIIAALFICLIIK